MTRLEAIEEQIKQLSPEEYAELKEWLEEQESEHRWDVSFERSSDMLSAMAAEAIREDEAGLTEPLDPEKL